VLRIEDGLARSTMCCFRKSHTPAHTPIEQDNSLQIDINDRHQSVAKGGQTSNRALFTLTDKVG
jgi:hypothetical protein